MHNIQTAVISTPTENWTHVYMDLFTQNSPYYHLLKYLLFLLKHPVCIYMYIYIYIYMVQKVINKVHLMWFILRTGTGEHSWASVFQAFVFGS